MGWLFVVAAVLVTAGVVTFVVVKLRRHNGEGSPARRRILVGSAAAVTIGVVLGAVALGASIVDTFQRRGLPPPEFPSLVTAPDDSLRGSVAYVSEAKSPTAGRQACARVAAASGTESRDAYCWPISEPALATVVWQPDGRLLVTSFDAPVGKGILVPEWAKLVDVATGTTEDVPDSELGDGARPSAGPSTNPEGQRLVRTGKDGNVNISLVGPEGSRTVFSVEDANPDWGIQTGPTWSPDFEWFLMWDGTRLLLTTVDDPAATRVLADESSGDTYMYDVPSFSITERDAGGS
jgi:hypothetical protein